MKIRNMLYRLKNQLIITAAFGCLMVIGSLMNSNRAEARIPQQFGLPVQIVSPVPVPVSVSTISSGTVAATQSGAWNVGITGTPNVNVINLNDPGRIPVQRLISNLSCSSGTCGGALGAPVPNGHRLVVQHVSVFAGATSGTIATMHLTTLSQLSSFPLTVTPFNTGTEISGDQAVLFFLDPGQQLGYQVQTNGAFFFVGVTLTGYMLDCSIAPCAAIQ